MVKRIVGISFLFSILSSHSPAQSVDFNQGGTTRDEYLVESPYESVRGKIILAATVGGKPRRFILDTGAPTAISEDLYAELRPTVLAREEISDIGGNRDSLRVVVLDRIAVGDLWFTDVPTLVIGESPLTECFAVDGIIGSNLLRNSVVQFDGKNKVIRIADDAGKLDTEKATSAPIMLDKQSSPVLTIRIGVYIREMVLFDSGADELYSMAGRNFRGFKKVKGFEVVAEGYGSNSMGLHGAVPDSEMFRLRIPAFILNDHTVADVIAEVSSDNNSRVGAGLLDYGILTIDYRNRRSFFEPFGEGARFQEALWDINLSIAGKKPVIGVVWNKKWRKTISPGDPVLAINGLPAENLSICDLLLNLSLEGLSRATLLVKTRNGNTEEIPITKY